MGISLTGFKGCVFFICTLVIFNDLAALRLNIFNGQISSIHAYKQICPLAQICRSFLNTITAITGPILFNIQPQLPFVIAAIISIIWTGVLILAFRTRSKTVKSIIQQAILSRNPQLSCVFKIKTYQLQEILAQLIESK